MVTKSIIIAFVLLGAFCPAAAEDLDLYPASVSEVDAINCDPDAPSHQIFAMSVAGDGGLAAKRGWRKVENGHPFLDEYELSASILVTGNYEFHKIASTSSGILAALDLAGPNILGREEAITNAADPELFIAQLVASRKVTRAEIESDITFRKFLG